MRGLINLIRLENFEREVIAEKKPVLLLCMSRDEEFPKQLRVIENIAARYGEGLKVGLLEEEFIETFKKDYCIVGTPTFLLLVEGKERDRILGLADYQMLTNLITKSGSL